ncbi:hypothetical protein STENM223S_06617 [Streptomyces tendae]
MNVLAEERTLPSDYTPLSIYTGIPWGYRTNAEAICVFLREQCALVVGPTGSGKTNMVHVILAGFARAADVLTWVIDLNAGSAGLPWARPAFDTNGAPVDGVRPGVDWLASTYEEAVLMLDAALAVGLRRKVTYQGLMAQANADQLPISAKIPQIMLVVDEGAEILTSTDRNMKDLAKKILEVIRMLRAMGVRTVLTALGATGSVLGNLMIRREAKARVCLTGGETEGMDLSKVFPGARGLRPDQAPYKGAGFMGTPESAAALSRSGAFSRTRSATSSTPPPTSIPPWTRSRPGRPGPPARPGGDADRTAWMRDTNHAPNTVADEQPSASGGGLKLSALRGSRRRRRWRGSSASRSTRSSTPSPNPPPRRARTPSGPRRPG